jgi:hypothetical protein
MFHREARAVVEGWWVSSTPDGVCAQEIPHLAGENAGLGMTPGGSRQKILKLTHPLKVLLAVDCYVK